jgi:hypothetical protein
MVLLHRLKVQYRVRFYGVTIKQLIQLVTGQGDGVIAELWPMEAVLFQAFVVQAKAIVLAEQDFDALVIAVGEHIRFC